MSDMKYIARRVNVDHGLALNLYDPLNYDAMYLAGLILDDVKMTKERPWNLSCKLWHGRHPGEDTVGSLD